MDKSTVSVGQLTEERLDAHYYGSRFIANARLLADCGLTFQEIGRIAEKCNCGATPVDVEYGDTGQGLIRTSDVRPNLFGAETVLRTNDITVDADSNVAAISGDLLFTMSGTIGYAAVIPDDVLEVFSFSNTIARVRFAKSSLQDARFLATFFNCCYGHRQSLRLTSGGIQGHVMPNPFKRLLVPTPHKDAQAYIGDKVRQAERLRARAARFHNMAQRVVEAWIDGGLREEDVTSGQTDIFPSAEHLGVPIGPNSDRKITPASAVNYSPKHLRIQAAGLTSRLDCGFYSPESLNAERKLSKLGCLQRLAEVVDAERKITNGVRGPEIQPSPYKLVRLQNIKNWKVDFVDCLTISARQFEENRRCRLQQGDVLVAIGGYIGNAGLVCEPELAVIGQHSAVLPKDPSGETDMGYLVAYLNSKIGAVQFQRFVSGTVEAGINLEDLREIPVPIPAVTFQEYIGNKVRDGILLRTLADGLIRAAKLLVEGLIDGKVNETDLQDAYTNRETDRAILYRLTGKGLDVADEPPLFPDLDQLEQALAEARGPVT
jgi:type I restriction enzyme S subunit